MDRFEQLAQILAADEVDAERLLSMSAEAAAVQLEEMGYDFTAEELKSFAARVKALTDPTEAELDENTLDDVTGGGVGALRILLTLLRDCGPILPVKWR